MRSLLHEAFSAGSGARKAHSIKRDPMMRKFTPVPTISGLQAENGELRAALRRAVSAIETYCDRQVRKGNPFLSRSPRPATRGGYMGRYK